tara:strand:- start:95 stop:685 length:591 start_codon:yes stop_codon:yes gene_type:complete
MNKNAKIFNQVVVNNIGNACDLFQSNLSAIVNVCELAYKAKQQKTLNEFLAKNVPCLVQEKIVENKKGEVKKQIVQVRDSALMPKGVNKNTIGFMLVIGENAEIAKTLPSSKGVYELSGLKTFVNDTLNPKNTTPKNKGKKDTKKATSKTDVAESAETLTADQFLELASIQAFSKTDIEKIILGLQKLHSATKNVA